MRPNNLNTHLGILLIFVLVCGFCAYDLQCPEECVCPHSQIVYCNRKQLTNIPKGISNQSHTLNLNDNSFINPVVNRGNFSQYKSLEHLYLSGCNIKYVAVDTFSDLTKLIFLDLSKNWIKTIADFTFSGLKLNHLFLNDNPGIQFAKKSFDGLRTNGLYLHNCGIVNLSVEVFRPLNGTLDSLSLEQNKFDSFEKEWFYLFRSLSHLRLGDNPLHCNCEVSWLHQFYQENVQTIFAGIKSPPICRSPIGARGKTFQDLTEGDFKCQLPVFQHVDVIFEVNIGKLTCRAGGDPVPTLYWIRPDGSTEIYYNKDDRVKYTDGILYITDPQSVSKAKYRCIASNPAGNVSFSLNVIWPPEKKKAEVDFGEFQKHFIPTPPPKKVQKVSDPFIESKQADSSLLKEPIKEPKSKYKWDEIVAEEPQKHQAEPSHRVKEVQKGDSSHFSMGDVVGAVIGTFLLTLIACVVTFHFYARSQDKMLYGCRAREADREKPPAPHSIYVMDNHEDIRGRMINNLGNTNYEDVG